MPNMSYCRFQNTASDLQDCRIHIMDDLEGDEFKAREQLILYCKKIVNEVNGVEFEEFLDD